MLLKDSAQDTRQMQKASLCIFTDWHLLGTVNTLVARTNTHLPLWSRMTERQMTNQDTTVNLELLAPQDS